VSIAVIRSEVQQALRHPTGYQIRSWVAAVLLALSLLLPYWHLTLNAPQYPGGLRTSVYLTRVGGDAAEIDILNHYIGMKSLTFAAPLERTLAVPLVLGGVLAVTASAFLGRLGLLLQAPAVVFPLGVVADLGYWLWRFGHSLDPTAPIRLDPFMPAIIGRSTVMQFVTHATFGWGFLLSAGTAVLALYNIITWSRHR